MIGSLRGISFEGAREKEKEREKDGNNNKKKNLQRK